MLRILLAVTALLIYGSLYPWQFHAGLTPGGPVNALLHSWQLTFNRFILRDIALNIAIYLPFGMAAYLWLHAKPAWMRFTLPVLLAALLSTSIELTQFYDAHRFTSLVDVATNVTGATLGMLLVIPAARRGVFHAIRIEQPGAILLFCCWLGAMLFPLIPDISRTHLSEKIQGFLSASFAPISMFALFVMWLAAARLLFARETAGILFSVLGLVLPLRFLITGLNAGWMYWASFGLAWLVWVLLFSRRKHDGVLAGMVILSLIATGLSPFQFSAVPQTFSWVPFQALFSTDWETGFAVFLNKAFLYGAATWLLQQAGLRLLVAAIGMAAGLAGIEAIQLFLPNHAAEVTDPLLVLLIAWVLHRLSRAVAHSKHDEPGSTFRYRARADPRNPSRL